MLDIYTAFLIDSVMGDPYWLPHPVRLMGKYIKAFEGLVRKITRSDLGLRLMGVLLTSTMVLLAFIAPYVLLLWLRSISTLAFHIANALLLYTCLAPRCLAHEAMKIHKSLEAGNIADSRRLLSYIVGRDTDNLDESCITKATVETVSENSSDGVIAPLFYAFLGGAPLAMAYKAINTLDSMVGYKNDRYLHFGWASAKLDDVANFIPARLTAVFTIASAAMLSMNWKGSLRVFIRDRRNHKSPNSGCPEAAAAGALGVQLGGTSMYFGKPVVKPTIGDELRPLKSEDIKSAIKLMYGAAIIALLLFGLIFKLLEKIL